MYKVLVDNKLFCSSTNDELAIINPKVTLEANAAGSFTFTIPSEHPFYDEITRRKSIISVYRDKDETPLFQGICVSESVDFFNQKSLVCEGELTYLNDSILRPQKYQGVTVLQLLTSYIDQHNAQVEDFKKFTIGNVTVTDPNNYITCYTNMNTSMQEIKEDLIDDLGGYLRVRYADGKKYIDYLADSTKENTQPIELGKNLLNFKSNIDNTDVASIIIPLGALQDAGTDVDGLQTRLTIKSVNSGNDYLSSSALINQYGRIQKTVIWDGITSASVLKSKAQRYLTDTQFEEVVIECTAVDMGYLGDRYNKFELLDKVQVKSEVHGMDRQFVIEKMTPDLNNPENDTFTFGKSIKKSLTARTVSDNAEVMTRIDKTIDNNMMTQAIQQASALITGVSGGHVVIHQDSNGKPDEILIMDTEDINTAQKVWKWSAGGFGYSKTGYRGQYGTAITMDGGIVADYITSGKLTALQITNGNGFSVTPAGKMTATSGTIAGWTMSPNALTKTVTHEGMTYTIKLSTDVNDLWSGDGFISVKDGNGIYAISIDGWGYTTLDGFQVNTSATFKTDSIFIVKNGVTRTLKKYIQDVVAGNI